MSPQRLPRLAVSRASRAAMASSSSMARRTSRNAAKPSSISPGGAGDVTHRSRLAALELGLDQPAEISRDGRALCQCHVAEPGPRLVGDRDPSDVMVALHIRYNARPGKLPSNPCRRVDNATCRTSVQVCAGVLGPQSDAQAGRQPVRVDLPRPARPGGRVLGAAGGQRESIFDREGSEEDPAGLRVGIQHRRVQVRGVGRDPGLSHKPRFRGRSSDRLQGSANTHRLHPDPPRIG